MVHMHMDNNKNVSSCPIHNWSCDPSKWPLLQKQRITMYSCHFYDVIGHILVKRCKLGSTSNDPFMRNNSLIHMSFHKWECALSTSNERDLHFSIFMSAIPILRMNSLPSMYTSLKVSGQIFIYVSSSIYDCSLDIQGQPKILNL